MKLQLNQVAYTYTGKYQTVTAVKEVSYTFAPGTIYAIIGASGSGKSTLLSLMAGLKLPTAGSICLDGQDTAKLDRAQLRREKIAVIYQNFNLFPMLTVEENVLYPLHLQRMRTPEARQLAREKLRVVGLEEALFRRLPNTLSGGEQQRVAIARALACGSELILADEPTGNLDSENTDNIVQILQSLAHQQQRCVIVVTHDPSVAARADIVLRMQDGSLGSA